MRLQGINLLSFPGYPLPWRLTATRENKRALKKSAISEPSLKD
jgi:hypothetical protein